MLLWMDNNKKHNNVENGQIEAVRGPLTGF
jgi:hypothetical protein